MPIAIQCPSCRTEYKVDEKLLGKKVKCRECGDAITVAPPGADDAEADVLALEDEPFDGMAAAATASGPSVKRCPSCRTPNSPSAVQCTACGYSLRPEPTVVVETIGVAAERSAPEKKKRRFVRDPGSPTLNSVDSLINLIIWWGCIAALAVWIVHLARSSGGISAGSLLPIGAVIVVGVLVLAPLMTIAIKVAARFLEFLPRNDTYNRVLLALLLPFGASLLSGWPGLSASASSSIISMAWLAAPALLIYLFRAEAIEWASTVGAACVALAVAWIIAGVAVSIVTSLTGPLYADALPAGPWLSFATGHSPAPAPTPPAKTEVAHAAPMSTSPTTVPFAANTANEGPAPANGIAAPASVAPGPAQQEAALTHSPGGRHPAASPFSPASPAGESAVPPAQSSFFAELQADDQDLQNVREVIPPFPPAPWMLVVKGGEGGAITVERYGLQPLTKKGVLSFNELPQQPNSYALSPRGDVIVAVVHFPKDQLQIASFDNKSMRTIPLDLGHDLGHMTPTMMGFLDQTHCCVSWVMGNQVKLQVWNTFNGTATHVVTPDPFDFSSDTCAISPNGRWLAVVGHGPTGDQQIIIYNMENGMIVRRITPTSSVFKPVGLAFSPDSTQIGLCAVVSNVTTLLSFKAQSGVAGFSGMLAPVAAPAAAGSADRTKIPGLLWLQNGQAWLVDGNDLYDCASGKKFGALHLPDMENIQLAGSDSVLILQRSAEGTQKLAVAKFDDGQIKAAIEAAK